MKQFETKQQQHKYSIQFNSIMILSFFYRTREFLASLHLLTLSSVCSISSSNYERISVNVKESMCSYLRFSVNPNRFLSWRTRFFNIFWHVYIFISSIKNHIAMHTRTTHWTVRRPNRMVNDAVRIHSDNILIFHSFAHNMCQCHEWMNVIWSNCYDQTISESSSPVYQHWNECVYPKWWTLPCYSYALALFSQIVCKSLRRVYLNKRPLKCEVCAGTSVCVCVCFARYESNQLYAIRRVSISEPSFW